MQIQGLTLREFERVVFNTIEEKSGRVVQADGSIRPVKDTGFRVKATTPFIPAPAQSRLDTQIFPTEYHVDDLKKVGISFGVSLLEVNQEAAAARDLGYLTTRIARQREFEAKENRDAAGN